MALLSQVILKDVIANIPAAGVAGRLFFATDTNVTMRDNGVSWDIVMPAPLINVMSAEGDLIVGGASGALTRLPAGASGQVLTSGGSGAELSWQTASGGSAPIATTSAPGIVKPDGITITVDVSGKISAVGGSSSGSSSSLFDLSKGVPALSSLTQVNVAGTCSVVENPGVALTVVNTSPPGNSGASLTGISQAVPTDSPYRVAFFVLEDYLVMDYMGTAFGWVNASGELEVVTVGDTIAASGYASACEYSNWSNPTTRNSVSGLSPNFGLRPSMAGMWLGLRFDGTNMIWEISATGAYWTTLYSTPASGGYLGSGGYSNVFVGLFNDDNTFSPTRQVALSVLCWDDTAISGRKVGTSATSSSGSGGSATEAITNVPLVSAAPGNFTVAHGMSSAPRAVIIQMTSMGQIVFQTPKFDATNLYLTASDTDVTATAACFA